MLSPPLFRFASSPFLALTLLALAGCGNATSKPPPDDTSCTVDPIDAGDGLEIPPPTGEHAAIGTHTRVLVDESRDDDPARLIAIDRAYALAFFGKHLRGDAAPLLEEPSGSAPKDFPEVMFTRRP